MLSCTNYHEIRCSMQLLANKANNNNISRQVHLFNYINLNVKSVHAPKSNFQGKRNTHHDASPTHCGCFFFFFFISNCKIITHISRCRRSGGSRVNSVSLCLHGKYLGAGHYCHILLSDCKEVPIKQIREEAEGLIEASNERPGRELG